MTGTRISTTVDFEKNGLQTGFLRLPHSVHESAYGWIPIPVVCIRNGKGPTVLLNSGNHGDEYEGQVTLMKLIRELKPEQMQGRIIFIPASNFPAAMAAGKFAAGRKMMRPRICAGFSSRISFISVTWPSYSSP